MWDGLDGFSCLGLFNGSNNLFADMLILAIVQLFLKFSGKVCFQGIILLLSVG